jgi:ABC-type transport system substrate-binding protein
LAIPASAALLAACGGDDEDPTATTTTGEPTATSGGAETSPTTAVDEPTATAAMSEPTATEEMAEATATEEPAEPSPTEGAAEVTELYGIPIEPAQNEGGVVVWGSYAGLHSGSLLFWNDLGPVVEAPVQVHPETFEPVPLLATAWESNDDATVWTFTIRENVSFHNGDTLAAEDVAFQVNLLQAIAYAEPPMNAVTTATPDAQTLEHFS